MLPLAIPAYVLTFVYLGRLGADSGVPLRSSGGAVLILTLALYPYVYMLARVAFRGQSRNLIEVARSLGVGRVRAIANVRAAGNLSINGSVTGSGLSDFLLGRLTQLQQSARGMKHLDPDRVARLAAHAARAAPDRAGRRARRAAHGRRREGGGGRPRRGPRPRKRGRDEDTDHDEPQCDEAACA